MRSQFLFYEELYPVMWRVNDDLISLGNCQHRCQPSEEKDPIMSLQVPWQTRHPNRLQRIGGALKINLLLLILIVPANWKNLRKVLANDEKRSEKRLRDYTASCKLVEQKRDPSFIAQCFPELIFVSRKRVWRKHLLHDHKLVEARPKLWTLDEQRSWKWR